VAAKRSSMTAPYLLDWRAYHGLTQAQLAEQAHVGISTIRKAENGEPISAISIGKLARFLGMAPRDLRERGPSDRSVRVPDTQEYTRRTP